ncbi:MAG: hypothetical protein Q3972_02990 [Corynebacterium sp.]|nr:hypothetical protein [Corynebacterium sp.]
MISTGRKNLVSTRKTMATRTIFGLGTATILAFSLSACSNNSNSSDLSSDAVISTSVGAAPAQASPASEPLAQGMVPAGQLITQPAAVHAGSVDSGLIATAGNILAVRTAEGLIIGDTTLSIPSTCGDLNSTGDTFVLSCEEGVYLIDAADPSLDNLIEIDGGATTAALTSTGDVIAGHKDRGTVTIVHNDGSTKTVQIGKNVDQLISIRAEDSSDPDGVYLIDHSNTTVHQVDWSNDKAGVTLRILSAVGRLAPAGPNTFIATDAGTNQVYVFSGLPIMMNHQYGVTGKTPWALVWDPNNEVAWVSTTADNKVEAYSFATGTPEKLGEFNAIAHARSLAMDESGNLYVAAQDSDQIQMLTAEELKQYVS